MKTKILSFDELDADQLKKLIQSGSIKKTKKKSKKLPLKEEKPKEKYNAGKRVLEVDISNYKL